MLGVIEDQCAFIDASAKRLLALLDGAAPIGGPSPAALREAMAMEAIRACAS